MINYWIVLGSIFGFLTIALGAFGAHGLKNILINNETTDIYNKAVLYQMFHILDRYKYHIDRISLEICIYRHF